MGREHRRATRGMPRVASPDHVPRKEADTYAFILHSPEESCLAIQMVTAALTSLRLDVWLNRGSQTAQGHPCSHGLAASWTGQQGSQCSTCRAVHRWTEVLAVTGYACSAPVQGMTGRLGWGQGPLSGGGQGAGLAPSRPLMAERTHHPLTSWQEPLLPLAGCFLAQFQWHPGNWIFHLK